MMPETDVARDEATDGEEEVPEAEDSVDAEAEVEVEEEQETAAPEGTRKRVFRDVALLLAATAVLAAGLFNWWQGSRHDAAQVELAASRDAVLIAAGGHIETMQTMDYRDVDGSLDNWAAATTGTLHDQIAGADEDYRKLLADQRSVSVGKVVESAVSTIDGDRATVLATVEVTVTVESEDADGETDSEPEVKRFRYTVDLVDNGEDWLIEKIEQVAVKLS